MKIKETQNPRNTNKYIHKMYILLNNANIYKKRRKNYLFIYFIYLYPYT